MEAFRVDPQNGRLTLLGRTALSLSATRPRHIALSPDGKVLAVAAWGSAYVTDGERGAIYQLIPDAESKVKVAMVEEPKSIALTTTSEKT